MSHIFLSGLKTYKTSKELLNAGKLPDVTTTDNSWKHEELVATIKSLGQQLQSMHEQVNSVQSQKKKNFLQIKENRINEDCSGGVNCVEDHDAKPFKTAQPMEKSVATVNVTTILHDFTENQELYE